MLQDIPIQTDKKIVVEYKGIEIETTLKSDILIDNLVLLEIKAVKEFIPVYDAQTLTYMKLLEALKGILINFCCTNIIKNGKKTFVNEFYRNLPD